MFTGDWFLPLAELKSFLALGQNCTLYVVDLSRLALLLEKLLAGLA